MLHTIRSWDWRTASLEAGSPEADLSVSTVTTQIVVTPEEPASDPRLLTHDALPVHDTADAQTVVLDPMPSPPGTGEPPPPANSEDLNNPAPDEASSVYGAETASEASSPAATVVTPPDGSDDNAPGGTKTATAEEDQGSADVTPERSPVRSAMSTQPVMIDLAPTETIELTANLDRGPALGDEASWLEFQYGPERKPEPDRPAGSSRSRSRVKVFGLVALGLTLAAVLAFGGIRLFDKTTKSGGRTQASDTGPVTATTHPGQSATGITAAQLTPYQGYADALQTANVAAAHAFDSGGATTPTTAQLALVVISYGKTLNNYNNGLASISWPTSMKSAVEADHAQLQALMSFLRSFSIVQASGVSAWLVQLHNRTSSSQAADNQVRHDLGLPVTTSFP